MAQRLYCTHWKVKVPLDAGRVNLVAAKVPVEPVERAAERIDAVLGDAESVAFALVHVVLVLLAAVA
jgi:hypothetical protein